MAQYDFRKTIIQNHKKIKLSKYKASLNELAFPSLTKISKLNLDIVGNTALNDFVDFLNVAFGIKAKINEDDSFISFKIDKKLDKKLIEYRFNITNKIIIYANNDRSFAQALYYLEFCLQERRYPCIEKSSFSKKMPYSPRMVHSGYGLDMFPNEYLSTIAHYGYDAILIFVKGVNKTTFGDLDFNDLCDRAEKYGIDVYAYCYIHSFTSPKDKEAVERYDKLYGEVFKKCPKLKGMVFVGESVEFLSEDKHVVKHRYNEYPKEGIPENKPSPGWWPCKDYALWVSMIRDSIRKYKKDADIVFWTYNWGWAPKKDRIALIKSLPTDISLNVTFEMFKKYNVMGVKESVSDYSLTYPYAGDYFLSEAKIAKERNIRLYAMSNTAGRTWDFGDVPYMPMPYQWIKRFNSIIESNKKFGLCGLMEGHHFGFYPSFISRLAYLMFLGEDSEKALDRVLKVEYGINSVKVKKGLEYVSESINYLPPTIENQYGPLRAGTAFPLCLIKPLQPIDYKGVHFGNRIWSPMYGQFESGLTLGFGDNGTPYAVREKAEMKMVAKMLKLLKKGIRLLEEENANGLDELLNLIQYIKCSVTTLQNVMNFYHVKNSLRTYNSKFSIKLKCKRIRKIAEKEKENAKESIAYLEKDSLIGFEPSMLYVNSKERIQWKLKQIDYMLEKELPFYENATK